MLPGWGHDSSDPDDLDTGQDLGKTSGPENYSIWYWSDVAYERSLKNLQTTWNISNLSQDILCYIHLTWCISFFIISLSNRRILYNKEGDKPSRPRYVLREIVACTKQDSSYSSQWPVTTATSCRNPLYIFVVCQKLEHIKKVKQIYATSCYKLKQGL